MGKVYSLTVHVRASRAREPSPPSPVSSRPAESIRCQGRREDPDTKEKLQAMTTTESCPACLDAGRLRDDCPMCEGEGWVDEIVSMDALAEFDDEEYPQA